MKKIRFSLLLTALLVPQFAPALVVGPYAPDANTVFLFHFDEPAGAYIATNSTGALAAGTNAVAFATVTGNTYPGYGISAPTNFNILGAGGATGFSFGNFGNAANLGNVVGFATNGIGVDMDKNGGFALSTNNSGTMPIASFDTLATHGIIVGANNSFTLEALINVSGTNGNQEIVCSDNGGANNARGFQFRLTGARMEFFFIGQGAGAVGANDIFANIPSSGANAFVPNQWFHVAFVHSEVGGGATNVFYWTALSDSAVAANAVGTNTAALIDPADPMPLVIGNEGRAAGSSMGSAEGLFGKIDEVRISNVARSANQMMFYTPTITFTTQPADQTITTNQTATFTAVAAGSGTITYQWYSFDATSTNAISGATANSLSVTSGSAPGTTNYFVVASNGGISTPATSSVVQLNIRIPLNLTWAGIGANWDASSLNWTTNNNTSQTAYTEPDNVTFNNLGSAQPNVSLVQTLHPASVTISGSTAYVLNGTGAIAGPGSLTMNGNGTVTLDTTNSYTGGTTVNSGTMQIGDSTTSGTIGTGPLLDNAAVAIRPGPSFGFLLTNAISGNGSLTINGGSGSSVTFQGSNGLSGGISVLAGSFHPQNTFALGTGPVTVSSGAQIYPDTNTNLNSGTLTLNGTGISGDGALRKGGGGTTTLGSAIVLGSDTTIKLDGGATLAMTNDAGINGATANANLTLNGDGGSSGSMAGLISLGNGALTVGGGTWTVSPNNNYTTTTINGGTLLVTGPLSLGPVPGSFNASQVTLNGGALGSATNVTLADGNIGIMVNANSTISATGTSVFTVSNNISSANGTVTLTKSGSGMVVLDGANSFSGNLNVDSGSTSANDGVLVIASPNALANIGIPGGFQGTPFIAIRNNNSGSSTLALDGSLGSVTIESDISFAGRNNNVSAINNLAGNNTISGNFELQVGGGLYAIQSDSGTLTLSSPQPIPYSTPTSSGRILTFQGAGNIVVSAQIQDGSNNGSSNVWNSVTKFGTGVLNLSAANSYNGATTVSNGVLSITGSIAGSAVTVAGGLLVGNGSIGGPVSVQAGGSIEAGATNSIGTLNLGNTLALGGNTVVKINKGGGTHDLFNGQSSVTYGGTLTVTNLSGTLTTNDTFTLFSPGTSASNFSSIAGSPGPGLAYSFTNGVLSIVGGIASNPTNIIFNVSGNTLTLSWPQDHLGWILQSQTNTLSSGLGTNWTDVPDSGSITSTNITVNPSNASVFFRLRYPN
ncbi:MAG TPA: autotransporter-associated beta strand repeat-containing protein [Verrucomicrobiae bacterium]|nr:autotransporter-associated beta strand repeat-containing protein [Verrucomicrobiae bacterium]